MIFLENMFYLYGNVFNSRTNFSALKFGVENVVWYNNSTPIYVSFACVASSYDLTVDINNKPLKPSPGGG